jgi:LuxR family transcriptional regulator, positive regulator of biofilm formation
MLKDVLIKEGLSNREAEVAELVTQGLSNKEVANRLFVTEKTVKFHLTNIYKKMNVKSRAQLIVWCLPNMTFTDKTEMTIIENTPSVTSQGNSKPVVEPTYNEAAEKKAESETPMIIPGQANKAGYSF